ncbi:ARM repeat-containing protein [Xylaria sp. CBS 124048]|nr:ARM repeat-containing protein [Xylaria sp. CBS 124048]
MADADNKKTQLRSSTKVPAWGQNPIWGATYPYARNVPTASAGSDELSPTAPSGSSQINSRSSESVPWDFRGYWGPVSPNHISPTRNGSNAIYPPQANEGTNTTTYPARPSINQGRSTLQNRTVPPGPAENSSYTSQNVNPNGATVAEERGSSNACATSGAPLGLPSDTSHIHRRNSTDPNFLGIGNGRPGTFPGRQSEAFYPQHTSTFGETAPFSYTNGGLPRPHNPRPSVSRASPPSPPETIPFLYPSYSPNINDEMLDFLTKKYASVNIAEVPNSYTWQSESNNGTRSFSNGTQQDSWAETPQTYHQGARKTSAETSPPVGGPVRQHVNSPRNMSRAANSRTDTWNRPVSRNPTMPHDLDRQQQTIQYPQQTAGHRGSYLNTPTQQLRMTYEQYPQAMGSYRPQVQMHDYQLPPNFPDASTAGPSRDPALGVRSKLLEEFRIRHKTGRHFELKDIYDHVVEFSGDQHGSRFIQDKLEIANSEEKEQLFTEILPNAVQLMKDVFGNYVIQKFFDYGSQVQKKLLARQMEGQVAELSIQMYSCRVVQKALEHVLVEQQITIVDELKYKVLQVAMDQNGNHVIQKIIQMFPTRCIPFTLEAFRGQVDVLAVHSYVCRVIQRILEHSTSSERRCLMAEIHPCAAKLFTDQYGNYVVQHILQRGHPEDRHILIQQVITRAVVLSKHKFASNVVEKCVQYGNVEDRRGILHKLTTASSDGISPLPSLMKDQYGNYVVQRLIEHLKGEEKTAFITEVKAYIPLLKRQCSGRQNTALDRLTTATESAHTAAATTRNRGDAASRGSNPSSPSLVMPEVNSVLPTPFLTTEQNSPQSTSSPSTNFSNTADVNGDTETGYTLEPKTEASERESSNLVVLED